MSILIRHEDDGAVHVHLTAATIPAAIALTERARRALCELNYSDNDDFTPADRSRDLTGTLGYPQADGSIISPATLAKVLTVPIVDTPAAPIDLPSAGDAPTGGVPVQPLPVRMSSRQSPPPSTPGANAANATSKPAQAPSNEPVPLAALQQDISATGLELFGEEWSNAAAWLCTAWTGKYMPNQVRNDLMLLGAEELTTILFGLIEHAAQTQAEWQKHKANEAIKAQAAAKNNGRRSSLGGRQRIQAASQVATADHAVDPQHHPIYATG